MNWRFTDVLDLKVARAFHELGYSGVDTKNGCNLHRRMLESAIENMKKLEPLIDREDFRKCIDNANSAMKNHMDYLAESNTYLMADYSDVNDFYYRHMEVIKKLEQKKHFLFQAHTWAEHLIKPFSAEIQKITALEGQEYEVLRLQAQIKELHDECDILKKTIAILSK